MKGEPKRIDFGNESEGITIEYIKSRNVLVIRGHFDHFVGIKSTEISVDDFCEKLGIKIKKK